MSIRGTVFALSAVALSSACGSDRATSASSEQESAGKTKSAGTTGSAAKNGSAGKSGSAAQTGAGNGKSAGDAGSAETIAAVGGDCASASPDMPMRVTDRCVDPRFNEPYVDMDQMRDTPAPHRYIHGGFTGTDVRFSFYFPPADAFEGRFFQYTHQLLNSEDSASEATIGFALASGGYYVQTNLGGRERSQTAEQAVAGDLDPAVGGYRANAAAAKFSREKAKELFGEKQLYGYLYGGSGGAYQSICSAEHTQGIWDGYVPFVMGTPNAIPGVFTVRIHALRVLQQRNKLPGIMDAIEPGGSGDPYADLNEEEASALREATRLGFPPRGFWNHESLSGGALVLVAGYVPLLDPTYTDDFWNLPGYLGHDDPTGSVAAARESGPTDNADNLALQTYHRHQLPTPDMYGWNSLRGSDGTPLYPQRDVLVGPVGAFNGAGCISSGHFNGKMIVVQNLIDIDAFPWQADWYKRKVIEAQGQGQNYEDSYRLYFTDHAQHTSPTPTNTAAFARTIAYTGVYEHALRDLSKWVEDGVPAPSSTSYRVDDDNQVVLPLEERKGIQLVPQLKANGGARAEVEVGQSVDFEVSIAVQEGGGKLIAAEWDFSGEGKFPMTQTITDGSTSPLRVSNTYTKPGTYFPVVRVTAQREGDLDHPYARVQNLSRVRVVVSEP